MFEITKVRDHEGLYMFTFVGSNNPVSYLSRDPFNMSVKVCANSTEAYGVYSKVTC